MLKDAVGIPGISMTYVLNKLLNTKQPGELELFASGQPFSQVCQIPVVISARKYRTIVHNARKTN